MAGFVYSALLVLFFFPALTLKAQTSASLANGSSLHFPDNEQLRRFKTMSDPRLAPDGKRILIRVTEPSVANWREWRRPAAAHLLA
jgi:hypothetical protein